MLKRLPTAARIRHAVIVSHIVDIHRRIMFCCWRWSGAVMPEWLLATWDIEYSLTAGLMARRIAVLFAALGVIFYLVRNEGAFRSYASAEPWLYGRLLGTGGTGFRRMAQWPCRSGHIAGGRVELALGLAFFQTRRVSVGA